MPPTARRIRRIPPVSLSVGASESPDGRLGTDISTAAGAGSMDLDESLAAGAAGEAPAEVTIGGLAAAGAGRPPKVGPLVLAEPRVARCDGLESAEGSYPAGGGGGEATTISGFGVSCVETSVLVDGVAADSATYEPTISAAAMAPR